MADLKVCRPELQPLRPCTGTWGSLVAWFSEMVIELDKGNLVAAAECQREIEKHGFRIAFRRLPKKAKGCKV